MTLVVKPTQYSSEDLADAFVRFNNGPRSSDALRSGSSGLNLVSLADALSMAIDGKPRVSAIAAAEVSDTVMPERASGSSIADKLGRRKNDAPKNDGKGLSL